MDNEVSPGAEPPVPDPGRVPWTSHGYTRFLIVGDARTGTTLLVEALNSAPSVICFAELFNLGVGFVPFGVEGYDNFDPLERELRNREPGTFLARRIFTQRPDRVGAVGFKLLYGQAWYYPGLMDLLVADRDLRIIHLDRLNVLRLLASRKIARETNVWVDKPKAWNDRARLRNVARHPLQALGRLPKIAQRLGGQSKVERAGKSVHVSAEELEGFALEHALRVQRSEQSFKEHPVHDIEYEDILSDRRGVFRDVQIFLGLEPVELSSTLRKQNPEPLRELVANYDELKNELRGTPLADCFTD